MRRALPLIAAVTLLVASCGSSTTRAASASSASSTTATSGPSSARPRTTSGALAANASCGATTTPPNRYAHVVVIMLENRRWPDVGGPGFGDMPYLHGLAAQCAYYPQWNETNANQSSLTQYIGITSGVSNPSTVNDCSPSSSCRSTDDNIFRQVRRAGGTPRSYVEGATSGCSASGNAAKHVPALYYYGSYAGGSDHGFCAAEVRPLRELAVDRLPTFAMITPNLCDDGHDCANGRVDAWLGVHLATILRGRDYRAGTTAVFVCYDEDRPVPNLVIAPTARRGPVSGVVAGHASALRTWEALLGLPTLAPVRSSPSLRASSHI